MLSATIPFVDNGPKSIKTYAMNTSTSLKNS